MKQFEKWESDGVCNIKVDCGDLSCLTACKKIKETVWRAALEWLGDEIISLDANGTIQSMINSELES